MDDCDCCCGDFDTFTVTFYQPTTAETLRMLLECPYGDPIDFSDSRPLTLDETIDAALSESRLR